MKNLIILLVPILILSCQKESTPIAPTPEPPPEPTACKFLLTGFFDLEECQVYWFNESNLDTIECEEQPFGMEVWTDRITLEGNYDWCLNPIHFWTHDLFYPVNQYCEVFQYRASIQVTSQNKNYLEIELDDNFLTDCPTSERGGFYFAIPYDRLE